MSATRDRQIEHLIQLRDSDRPEERAQYLAHVTGKPTVRMTIGYYEADLAKQGTE
ncbi:hypothetical protein [Microbacterium lacus]|uniref:hypothetical protein n=1 Tax=Microbacterium lacus TaxID=415217 RepID=UPI0012FDF32B|nr:hypothetical protein [Microbacterium lacus]